MCEVPKGQSGSMRKNSVPGDTIETSNEGEKNQGGGTQGRRMELAMLWREANVATM